MTHQSAEAHDYHYQVRWSQHDREYAATVDEFPLLSCLDKDPDVARDFLQQLVGEIISDMEKNGEPVPLPLDHTK